MNSNKNRFIRYLDMILARPYVIVGSGSAVATFIDTITAAGLQAPQDIFDEMNVGKQIGGFTVKKLNASSVDGVHVLVGSFEFKNEIRQRILKHNSPLTMAALDDFSHENNGVLDAGSGAHPILVNTIPKCGNAFIVNYLENSYGIRLRKFASGPWPAMHLSENTLSTFKCASEFSVDHIPATADNLALLKKQYISKIMVHARDPRQATLSWLHWIDKRHKSGILHAWENPPFNDYFDWTLEQKLDYQIDNWLPSLVTFLQQWVDVKQSAEMDVLFTDFTLMRDNPGAFFDDIGTFFHMPVRGDLVGTHSELSSQTHFRKGLTDEWKSVFTPAQIERASGIIPAELKNIFGWEN